MFWRLGALGRRRESLIHLDHRAMPLLYLLVRVSVDSCPLPMVPLD